MLCLLYSKRCTLHIKVRFVNGVINEPAINSSMIADSGSVALVTFRARCETLGHGEEVFLVKEDDVNLANVRSV
jgi:hypothetical protein